MVMRSLTVVPTETPYDLLLYILICLKMVIHSLVIVNNETPSSCDVFTYTSLMRLLLFGKNVTKLCGQRIRFFGLSWRKWFVLELWFLSHSFFIVCYKRSDSPSLYCPECCEGEPALLVAPEVVGSVFGPRAAADSSDQEMRVNIQNILCLSTLMFLFNIRRVINVTVCSIWGSQVEISPSYFSLVVDFPAHSPAAVWLAASRLGRVLYLTATSLSQRSAQTHRQQQTTKPQNNLTLTLRKAWPQLDEKINSTYFQKTLSFLKKQRQWGSLPSSLSRRGWWSALRVSLWVDWIEALLPELELQRDDEMKTNHSVRFSYIYVAVSPGHESVYSLSASLNPIWAPTPATLAHRSASTSIRRCSFSTMAICLCVRCSSTSASRRFTWDFNSVTHLWAWGEEEHQRIFHLCATFNSGNAK